MEPALGERAGERGADARRRARHEGGLAGCQWDRGVVEHATLLPEGALARQGAERRRRAAARPPVVWIVVIAVLSAGAAAPAARGQAPLRPERIAAGGFGDARNSYVWSMAWFKGRLYVGTARSAMCVEGATIDFHLPFTGFYREHPVAGVTCPPSIFEADLRAEIWRYTPASGRWERVYRSPTIANPRAPGYRVAPRHRLPRHGGRARRPRPAVALRRRAQPGRDRAGARAAASARLLRSTDGETFRALRGRPRVIRTNVGARRPVGYRALAVARPQL